MTDLSPTALAYLHARCFSTPRPWTEFEFGQLMANPGTILAGSDLGFVLAQVVLDEAEILTLAVAPQHRRQGLGADLVKRLHSSAKAAGADRIFLEVSAENQPAQALYAKLGYDQVGRRPRYYQARDGQRFDALILARDLT